MAKNTVAPVKNIKTAVNPVIKNYQKEQEEAAMNMENISYNIVMETIAALTERVVALEASNKALMARLTALEVAANGVDIPNPTTTDTTTTDTTENKAETTTTENKPAPKTRRKKAAATTTEKKPAEKKSETTTEKVDYSSMSYNEVRALAKSLGVKAIGTKVDIIARINNVTVETDAKKAAEKAINEATAKAEKKATTVKPANADTATMIADFLANHKKPTKATAEAFVNDAVKALGWCRAIKMLKDTYKIEGNKFNKTTAIEALKAACRK